MTCYRKIDNLPRKFPRIIIDDVEYAKSAARAQLIRHEIQRPPLVPPNRQHQRPSRTFGQALALSDTNLQTLFDIDSIGPLVIDNKAFRPKHRIQNQIAVTGIPGCKGSQTAAKPLIARTSGSIPADAATYPDQPASTTPAHHLQTHKMMHCFAPKDGLYQFFDKSPLSSALSRCASANNCLSLRFSASSSLSPWPLIPPSHHTSISNGKTSAPRSRADE